MVNFFHLLKSDKMKMDIFRAILRKGELSDRVLNLTTELLDMNAANYTVWYVTHFIPWVSKIIDSSGSTEGNAFMPLEWI